MSPSTTRANRGGGPPARDRSNGTSWASGISAPCSSTRHDFSQTPQIRQEALYGPRTVWTPGDGPTRHPLPAPAERVREAPSHPALSSVLTGPSGRPEERGGPYTFTVKVRPSSFLARRKTAAI